MTTVISVAGVVVDDVRLKRLAQTIQEEYGMVCRRGREALEHAINVGEALLEARTEIPRGEWVRWLEENVPFSVPTCYMYENLYMNRARLLEGGAVQSITEALRILKGADHLVGRKRQLNPHRKVEISDELIEVVAQWFFDKFPQTVAKLGASKSDRVFHDWAMDLLTKAFNQENK